MTKAVKMITRLRTNFDGTAWHGTPLRRILDGIDDNRASAHPIPNARSIAELLAHITAWIEIVEQRLRGEQPSVTHEMDFPDPTGISCRAQLERLDAAFERLTKSVAEIDDFSPLVAGQKYSLNFMLDGLMHHNTYHAAQIAMLKKF